MNEAELHQILDDLFAQAEGDNADRQVDVAPEEPAEEPDPRTDAALGEAVEAAPPAPPAPDGPELGAVLQGLLAEKYRLVVAYMNYGDKLQHAARDGLHRHFAEHIGEERALAYELAKKLSALGLEAPAAVAPPPEVAAGDLRAMLCHLLDLEDASVHCWQRLFEATTHDAALNGLAQEGALRDQQHADDMRRYLQGIGHA